MLYEVITESLVMAAEHRTHDGAEAEGGVKDLLTQVDVGLHDGEFFFVITSYSIHYTKLYDLCFRSFCGVSNSLSFYARSTLSLPNDRQGDLL